MTTLPQYHQALLEVFSDPFFGVTKAALQEGVRDPRTDAVSREWAPRALFVVYHEYARVPPEPFWTKEVNGLWTEVGRRTGTYIESINPAVSAIYPA